MEKNTNVPLSDLRMENHMIFICPECSKEHTSQLDWRRHLNIIHNYINKNAADFNFKVIDEKYHECLVCSKWVQNAHLTPAVLQYHRFNHLPFSKIYRCRHCRGDFLRKRTLIDHLWSCHNALVKNRLENKAVDKQQNLKDPAFNKEFYMRFLCPLCGLMFTLFSQWQHHVDSAHTSTSVDFKIVRIACTRNYHCYDCALTLKDGPTRSQLQRHHFSHLPYPSYFQCAYCFCRKDFKCELLLHFMTCHTQEYLKNKQFVFLPEEWGASAQSDTITKINDFIKEASKMSTTDILQRALHNSCITFEEEEVQDVKSSYNHEQALDQSLKSYENVFVVEMGQSRTEQTHQDTGRQISDVDDVELEEIYKVMFEEIPESTTPSMLGNEKFQQEMQKYIHYLCPECGLEFKDHCVKEWRSHVYEQHNLVNAVASKFRPLNAQKSIYLCLECHQVQRTSKQSDLRRHHFQHMPFQSYLKCNVCLKTKSSKPKMLEHLEYVHFTHLRKEFKTASPARNKSASGKKLHCLECDKTYTVLLRFRSHCRTCPKRLRPLVCQYNAVTNKKLLEHLKSANVRMDAMLQEPKVHAETTESMLM